MKLSALFRVDAGPAPFAGLEPRLEELVRVPRGEGALREGQGVVGRLEACAGVLRRAYALLARSKTFAGYFRTRWVKYV